MHQVVHITLEAHREPPYTNFLTHTDLLIVREHARGGSMGLTADREGIPLATIFNAGCRTYQVGPLVAACCLVPRVEYSSKSDVELECQLLQSLSPKQGSSNGVGVCCLPKYLLHLLRVTYHERRYS